MVYICLFKFVEAWGRCLLYEKKKVEKKQFVMSNYRNGC